MVLKRLLFPKYHKNRPVALPPDSFCETQTNFIFGSKPPHLPQQIRITRLRIPVIRTDTHSCKVYSFFVLRFAIFQACFAARTLTIMQGSEEKEKNAVQIKPELEACQTRALTTTPHRRRCKVVKLP